MARPPNPKLRIAGSVLLVLALLCLISTATGWKTQGSTAGRIALGVGGVVLLLLGLALITTRVPAVRILCAEQAGMSIATGNGYPFILAWNRLDAVWMSRLSPVFGGYLLLMRPVSPLPPSPLRLFEHRQPDGSILIRIGLNRAQAQQLPGQLASYCPCFVGVEPAGSRLGRR